MYVFKKVSLNRLLKLLFSVKTRSRFEIDFLIFLLLKTYNVGTHRIHLKEHKKHNYFNYVI